MPFESPMRGAAGVLIGMIVRMFVEMEKPVFVGFSFTGMF